MSISGRNIFFIDRDIDFLFNKVSSLWGDVIKGLVKVYA